MATALHYFERKPLCGTQRKGHPEEVYGNEAFLKAVAHALRQPKPSLARVLRAHRLAPHDERKHPLVPDYCYKWRKKPQDGVAFQVEMWSVLPPDFTPRPEDAPERVDPLDARDLYGDAQFFVGDTFIGSTTKYGHPEDLLCNSTIGYDFEFAAYVGAQVTPGEILEYRGVFQPDTVVDPSWVYRFREKSQKGAAFQVEVFCRIKEYIDEPKTTSEMEPEEPGLQTEPDAHLGAV